MPLIENRTDDLIYMTAPNISISHAFTTRLGGVSSGIYASLNLGENRGDLNDSVRRNYEIICAALGIHPDRLVFSKQVHGKEIRRVTNTDCHSLFTQVPYEADGLITDEEDLPLIIFTADCIPVLLHDPYKRAVGAIHAGWRGTVADIVGEAVRKMTEEFNSKPEFIKAAIGPGISQCCFETGPEVPAAVRKILGSASEEFIFLKGAKTFVDLKGINCLLLEHAGILRENIEISEECTACCSEKYWSHRITKGERGSQASIIMMKGKTAR